MCDECYEKIDEHRTKYRFKKGTTNAWHCLTEPAITQGSNWTWCKNGKLHREDGPALHRSGEYYYSLEGIMYNEAEYCVKIKEYRKEKLEDL